MVIYSFMSAEHNPTSLETGTRTEPQASPWASKEEMHPLRLAENIGFFALNHFGYDTSHRSWSEDDDLDSAWNNAEIGLSVRQDTAVSRAFFKVARARGKDISTNTEQSVEARLRSVLLLGAISSFQAVRITEGKPSAALAHQILYSNKGRIAQSLAKLSKDPILTHHSAEARKSIGTLNEVLSYALLLRSGKSNMFPYPASPREDSTFLHKYLHLNHDIYSIHKGQKVPIQVKRSEEEPAKRRGRLRSGVATLVLAPIIESEVETLREDMVNDGQNIDWYANYSKAPQPDIFLAQCFELDPAKFRTAQDFYAANLLVKRTSDAVVKELEPQVASIQKRIDTGTLPIKNQVT